MPQRSHKSHLTLMDCDYACRLKTQSIFEAGTPTAIFDVFVLVDDMKIKEFNLFENIWRETLLLNFLHVKGEDVATPVINFG